MVTRVDVSPDLLTWAVGRAGWNDEVVQRRAPKLSEWLEGRRPTLKQLEKFACDTHTPFGLLFLDEPPVEASPIPEALEFVGSVTIQTSVDVVASQIRQALRFEVSERGTFANWEDALRRLIDRIEALGVLVMVNGVVGSNTHRKLRPQEFRGFALADPLAPLVFVNGADTKAAQIFTLIHELGHVWLGESALSDAAMTARGGIEDELWCNRLAAEVLVPLSLLRTEYRGDPNTAELERLAERYRVSTLVVLKRIHDAGFIEWDTYRARYQAELQRVMAILDARRSPEGGGNYYTQPLRLGRLFARAVVASTKEGGTAYRDAYQCLGTKKHETFENLAAELGVG